MRFFRRPHASLEMRIVGLVGILVFAVIILGLLAIHKDSQSLLAQQRIDHDQAVITTAQRVLSDLQNAETGQRGYLITRNTSYLAPYRRGIARVYDDITALQSLLPPNQSNQHLIGQIKATTGDKLTELGETIALRNGKGFRAAAFVVDDNQGKRDMDALRVLLADTRHTYQQKLATEFQRAKARLGNTELLSLICACALLAIVIFGFVKISGDLRQKRLLIKRLHSPKFRMPITGLPNRALFMDWLSYQINLANREGGKVAILLLDIDGYGAIAKRHGQNLADSVLREAAIRFRTTARSDDLVAHLGEDQFAVLMTNAADEHDMTELGHRLIDTMSLPVVLDSETVTAGVSVGIAIYPTDARRAGNLLEVSAEAVAKAKAEGRHRVAFCKAQPPAHMSMQTQLRNDFHRALSGREFCVHYQPIVDAKSMRLTGAEALVRWLHPSLGLLPPGEFLVLAERTGFIRPLGAWILQQACAQAEAWRQKGLELRISVNISAQQCREDIFISEVETALNTSGLPQELLELELTEGVLIHEEAERVIRHLGEMGIAVAIDDFGTGYASLNYLQRISAHRLKIDRAFVRGLPKHASTKLLSGIVHMAHRLELEVTAEGVEELDQEHFLRGIGCDALQGFRYSRALGAADFEAWSHHWAASAIT